LRTAFAIRPDGEWAAGFWGLFAAAALVVSLLPAGRVGEESAQNNAKFRMVRDGQGHLVALPSKSGEVDIFWGQGVASYLLIARQPERTVGAKTLVDRLVLDSPLLARSFDNLRSLRLLLTMRGGPLGAGPEAVAARMPDAIITIPWAADIFRNYHLPALSVSNKPGERGVLDDTIMQADVADNRDRGTALNASFRASMQALEDEAKDLPEVTLIALGTEGSNVFWYSNTELFDTMYGRARAKNLLPLRGFHRVDIEAILAADPEVIVLRQSNYRLQLKPDDFLAEPWAARLRAVRAKRVYSVPPLIAPFGFDVIQLPLFNRWLAAILHPGEFGRSLREAMSVAIRDQLGVQPTQDDLDRALGVPENATARPF
jgi:ABC-type Fe3+-hydroxamate transport system substrate-binding protein